MQIPRLPGLGLADADWLVATAFEVGAERGYPPLAVTVTDVSGAVIALRRADGCVPMCGRIAIAKARTALLTLLPSGRIPLPGEIVTGLQSLRDGDYIPLTGGVPVTENGVIAGAIGASGADASQDEEAVLTAVERWHEFRSHSD